MNRDQEADGTSLSAALEFQSRILNGVSRTFALTIPSLPHALRVPVTNAYLLCRIADTVEDEPGIPIERKRAFGRQFVEVLEGRGSARRFAGQLVPLLGEHTLSAERELISRTPDVVRITHSFDRGQRDALIRCVALMSDGMYRFQQQAGLGGLESQARMDEYCYFVAGVVGEMLTELFCEYSGAIARRRARLMRLAPSFGQGLQMTNILKDVWDDRARGACWLPQTAFGVSPGHAGDLVGELDDESFRRGIEKLVVVAHGHLRNALGYTLLIPRRYLGIRRFCLWALGMAVPTLTNIQANPGYRSGEAVKISRSDVRRIVRRYGLMAGNDSMLKWQFERASANLPQSDPGVAAGLDEISRAASASTVESRADEPIRDSIGAN